MTLIGAAAVVVGGRVCRPGWLRTCGTRIAACGPGTPPRPADLDAADGVVVPGFVDMHVHGGGGAGYEAARSEGIAAAARFHRGHGTTTTVASLVTAAPDALLDAVTAAAAATRQGAVAGIHLEGPWLAATRCGAHDRARLRCPDPAEIDAVLAAGDGTIRMVTLAPELPGAVAAIRRLVDAGVVVAVGHTEAGYDQTRQAIGAGARVGTHVFNAMPALHHREPGPVPALLEDPRVIVEVIADGVHLHPAAVRHVIGAAGPDRVALVTDATAAAGCGPGAFSLGGVDVDVVAGVARVRGTTTIAGSTATMDALFRNAVGYLGSSDAALAAAVRMTSTTPARALGLEGLGDLQPGFDANLVVLDRDLRVRRVMAGGDWQPFATLGPVTTRHPTRGAVPGQRQDGASGDG